MGYLGQAGKLSEISYFVPNLQNEGVAEDFFFLVSFLI